ncbi:conserved hypothetical protein [Vibrio chagasii]|nr:conserved hypothetical protein [Vibrio chagasii]CAH6918731.1 conserved hypothetical protein [Vibrio chagasii]CAH7165920.1 conserved hypothetical protein [Vibrio chagasii]CAH7190630.1 conserved hypothetical protein [Vibrio chagasii]CAH7216547.1 conserved hypothetical protein [Vibrio chagasii]
MKDNNSRRPLNIQEMQDKLKEMGIDKSLAHLNASGSSSFKKAKSQPSDPAPTVVPEVLPAVSSPSVPVVESDTGSNQQVPVVDQDPAELELTDWCIHVFGSFLSVYETQWEYQYGSEPSGKFIEFANSVDSDGLNRVLMHCHERIQLGNSWPPQMGELWILKDSLTEEELLDSRIRVLSRTAANKIEKWLIQNKLYDLKRTAENKLDGLFKKYYLEAKRLDEKGMLETELPQFLLAANSVKNLNDLKREEYESKHGKALNPRIQQILNSKK